MDETGSDIKGVFSGIAALIVVTLLIVVPVVCVFIKWHQRQREMVISNPVTYGRYVCANNDRHYCIHEWAHAFLCS